jgi:hypothetical protein
VIERLRRRLWFESQSPPEVIHYEAVYGRFYRPNQLVDVLARYNSEVSRGIVHTPEWKAEMAKLQERFNAGQI